MVIIKTTKQKDYGGIMSKRKNGKLESFGNKLAELRKAAGYTQLELATEIGVSRRMIAYYETESLYPPAGLLADLAIALNVSTDDLLKVKPIKKTEKVGSTRLQRKLQQIEKLGAKEKRQIMQFLDTFIERERLKKKTAKD